LAPRVTCDPAVSGQSGPGAVPGGSLEHRPGPGRVDVPAIRSRAWRHGRDRAAGGTGRPRRGGPAGTAGGP